MQYSAMSTQELEQEYLRISEQYEQLKQKNFVVLNNGSLRMCLFLGVLPLAFFLPIA